MMKISDKIKEYKTAKAKEHNVNDLRVKVIKKRGWIKYPTGFEAYVVELAVTAPGFKDSFPVMYIPKNINENWYII